VSTSLLVSVFIVSVSTLTVVSVIWFSGDLVSVGTGSEGLNKKQELSRNTELKVKITIKEIINFIFTIIPFYFYLVVYFQLNKYIKKPTIFSRLHNLLRLSVDLCVQMVRKASTLLNYFYIQLSNNYTPDIAIYNYLMKFIISINSLKNLSEISQPRARQLQRLQKRLPSQIKL